MPSEQNRQPLSTDPVQRVVDNFKQSIEAANTCVEQVAGPIADAARLMVEALLHENKILACGNGGSASDALHFTAELLNRFEQDRPPLAALSLNSDMATLTAIANDYDYGQVFSKQILALGLPGDILLAITTSGNSENVIQAVTAAHEHGMNVVAMSGRDGGELANILQDGDVSICVPNRRTTRIQEIHGIAIHCICDLIDHHLLGNH